MHHKPMPKIISRADAKCRGLAWYYTGKPCVHGHRAERYVYGACIKCERLRNLAPKPRAGRLRHSRGVMPHEIPPPPEDGRCECCGEVAKLQWDHDHDLESLGYPKVETHRGWICFLCNTGLGKLGDNVQGLARALRYVRKAVGGF
jgi:hypothetical protein